MYGRDQLNDIDFNEQYQSSYDTAQKYRLEAEALRKLCRQKEETNRAEQTAEKEAQIQEYKKQLAAAKDEYKEKKYAKLILISEWLMKQNAAEKDM